jgi:hypothetical protein
MPSEQVLDGVAYRIGTLNALQQFHVARRLAPVIAKLSTESAALMGAAPTTSEGESPPTPDMTRLYGAIAEAVASLSDADCNYVISTCMGVVGRKMGEHVQPVWNKAAGQPQFEDMTLPTLLQLTIAVITDNLGSFTSAQGGPGSVVQPFLQSVH